MAAQTGHPPHLGPTASPHARPASQQTPSPTTRAPFTASMYPMRMHMQQHRVHQRHITHASRNTLSPQQCTDFRTALPKSTKCHIGPLGPTTSRQSAGVGMLPTNDNDTYNWTPITQEFREAIETGRINKYLSTPSHKTHVYATVLYGWTGGHTNTTIASKADNLLFVARS